MKSKIKIQGVLMGLILNLMCLIMPNNLQAGEPGGQCPEPNLEYSEYSGEKFWASFILGGLVKSGEGINVVCYQFNFYGEHGETDKRNIFVSKKAINNSFQKEKGLLKALKNSIEPYLPFHDFIKDKDLLNDIYKEFSEEYLSHIKKFTKVRFKTVPEWFEWWRANKETLKLSGDGTFIVSSKKKKTLGKKGSK